MRSTRGKVGRRHGYRSNGNWRYSVVKKMRQRARKFRDRAETVEKREAWEEVNRWLTSILSHRRLNDRTGSIRLPMRSINALEEE